MPKLNVQIKLVGEDGNAHAILGRCERAMRCAGIKEEVRAEFIKEATSSDYNHLLRTVMDWFETDPNEQDEDEQDEDGATGTGRSACEKHLSDADRSLSLAIISAGDDELRARIRSARRAMRIELYEESD